MSVARSMIKRTLATGIMGGTAGFAALSYRDGLAVTLARADGKVRPSLATILPHGVFVWMYSVSRPLYLSILAQGFGQSVVEFPAPCTTLGLRFRGDLGNAAGLDKEASLLDFNYELGAGFAIVGTVLSTSHTGNIFEMLGGMWRGNAWTPLPQSSGALNSLGLPSHGIDVALKNIEDFRRRRGIDPQVPGEDRPLQKCFPIGVSIMGHPAHTGQQKFDGVVECVRKAVPVADFIEINESCPNVKHGGASDELAARLSAVVRARDALVPVVGRKVPILVKLGDVGDAEATVRLLAAHGIDGVVAVNTQRDYSAFELPAADRSLLEYYTERHAGGLSGPPIKELALKQAAAITSAVRSQGLQGKFAVVHVGGLAGAVDVTHSRQTGAELRQWYTGLLGALAEGGGRPLELYPRVTAVA